MSYKSEVIWSCIAVVSTIIFIAWSMSSMFTGGRESAQIEILEQCQSSQTVKINDIEIHCGVISSDANLEASKYRSVKNCVKLIEGWINE
jgi:uncharacterized membrane protein YvbJ